MTRSLVLSHSMVYLLLVMASTGHDESENIEDIMQCHGATRLSPFETREGNGILSKHVYCEINSEQPRVEYHFDISTVVQTRVPNGTLYSLSYLTLEIKCCSSIELDFTNLHELINKNVLSKLVFAGPCIVSMQNLAVWSNATDLLSVGFGGGIKGRNPQVRKDFGTLERSIKTLTTIEFDNGTTRDILDTLSSTEKKWPVMAELALSNLSLEIIPHELHTTMPLLQTLQLQSNKLKRPPNFPWSNSILELPRGLTRSNAFNDEIKNREGIDIDTNIYSRILRLDANYIEDLASYEFKGFLHKLSLAKNGLRKVGTACFRNLNGIQAIDLSKNKLEVLPPALFHGLYSLLEIRLGENNLTVIPPEIFKDLKNIKKITLDYNRLKNISSGLFVTLDRLEVLHLEGNKLETIEEGAFSNDSVLQEIYLQNNNFTHIPSAIFRLRNVSKIDLSHNKLTFHNLLDVVESFSDQSFTSNFSFKGAGPKLLILSNNNFTALEIRGLSEVKERKITRFLEKYEIQLAGNALTCDCSILAIKQKIETLFKINPPWKSRFKTWKCEWPVELKGKNILEINEKIVIAQKQPKVCPVKCSCFERCLDKTIIIDCQGRNLTKLPRILPHGPLIELNLKNNNIREIPVYPFLNNVFALYLTHNKIQHLNAMAVKKLKRIRILHVDSNNLTSLPRNIEDIRFTNIALHGNAFKCHCSLKWMKNWLHKLKHMHQVEHIEKVLCEPVDNSDGLKAIYTLPNENFGCNGTAEYDSKTVANKTTIVQEKISTIIAVTLGGLLAMNLIIFILLYKYRAALKAFMYTRFKWHQFDRIDDLDSTNKTYDAFVSYSEKERHWVENTLQARLENRQPSYKLCIHHRDFEVGAPIVRNILNSVEQSKRMLMVLSRHFLQSEWCMLEFRTAHHKVLEDRLKLIIILFDDVNLAELDDEMKLYMRTNTYLSVSDKWFWEKLIRAMPQSSVRNE